jgi:hypothetical protein
MNKQTSWSGDGEISVHGDPVKGHGGDSFTKDSEGKIYFQGMGCRSFCGQVSLSAGVPLGNLGRVSFAGNGEKQWEEGPENGPSVFTGALLREPGVVKEGYENGHIFLWRSCWENWERAHMPWAYVWKKVLGRVSRHTGALLGDLARGVRLLGTLRDV